MGADINRIAVFGLSGVGKSTSCRAFVQRHPEYLYVGASAVLREMLPSAMHLTSASALAEVQIPLARAIASQVDGREKVIFDLHSLLDADEGPVKVPVDAIRIVAPTALVFLHLRVAQLALRRAEATRPRTAMTLSELRSRQRKAKDQVRAYARTLQLPTASAEAEDINAVETAAIALGLVRVDSSPL